MKEDRNQSLGTANRRVFERRQVTVLFCDLVGSTRLAVQLDPEDFRDILRAYQACCAESIERHNGFIAQYLGDGVVAYFGHPSADEDAAQQAVHAASDVLHSLSDIATVADALQARIGIATGLAVVGDTLGSGISEQTAITGQVAILASRIQSVAAANVVTIADSTRQLIGDVFHCTDLGLQQFKGIDQRIRVWSVGAERQHGSRFEAMRGRGAGALVGRRRELRALQDAWRAAQQSGPQSLQVVGDPGIGKSTLIRELRRHAEEGGAAAITLQCSPRYAASPLYPLVDYIKRAAHLANEDDGAHKFAKLQSFLDRYQLQDPHGLLAKLLSLGDVMGGSDPPLLAAEQQKRETFALLLQWFTHLATKAPLLVLVEDTHWADPTTNDFVKDLLATKELPLLLIATARPEAADADWANAGAVKQINLTPLQPKDAATLVARVANDRLPAATIDQILTRSDGVPLFLEEMVRAALNREGDDARQSTQGIPMTLQDGLAARLDGLGSAKLTAQVAAVFGRSFTLDLLTHVLDRSKAQIIADLVQLQSNRLIRKLKRGQSHEYVFTHALFQEAAYESLLRNTRRTLHARTVSTLEDLRPDLEVSEPEIFAQHCEQAADHAKAAHYWLRAGQIAQVRAANVEAQSHFGRGLRALTQLDAQDTPALELDLQLGIGQTAYVLKGPAHEETVAAYSRAQELVDTVADPEKRGKALWGIFSLYHFASKFDLAEMPARRILTLGKHEERLIDMCQGHRMLGYLAFFRGRLDEAILHYEALAELYPKVAGGLQAHQYGADCLVGVRGFHAVIESVSQPYRNALARAKNNMRAAQELDHPASLGWAYASTCYVHYFGRDVAAAKAVSDAGASYCETHGIASWRIHCRLFGIWADAMAGQSTGCADAVRRTMALAAPGNRLGLSLFRTILAEILLREGDAQAALHESETALSEIQQTGQFFFHPIAALLRARCIDAATLEPDAAQPAYRGAISIARRLGARVIELQALRALNGGASAEDCARIAYLERELGASAERQTAP